MLEHIKKETLKFLQSDAPEVLVIKGQWGTGKTFTWKEWLTQAIESNQVALRQYAYVSLFGCTSLDQLKAQVFEETITVSDLKEKEQKQPLIENIKSDLKKEDWLKKIQGVVTKIDKFTNISKNLPYVSIDLGHLGWLSVKNTLICIDDIERHGRGLDTKDIYGLISVLKEQRSCKIVLILNDESIKDENKKVYNQYREKVVDVELHFDPETDELIQLIFDRKNEHYNRIVTCIKALGEKNIRTIQKIKRYIDIISPHLKDLPDSYQNSIISSIVLFTVLYFSSPEQWPSLDEVLDADTEKFGLVGWVDDEEKARIHNVDLEWIQNLSILRTNYEWAGADETDQILGQFVKQGYLNRDELQAVLNIAAQEASRAEAKDEVRKLHHKVGEILHESMADNFDELVNVMHESIQKSTALYPSVAHLNQYVSILRALEANDEANALIDYYIKLAEKKNSHFFDLSSSDRAFSGPLDKTLEEKIQTASKNMRDNEIKRMLKEIDRQQKIQEVVNKSYERSFSSQDIETLSRFTSADFITFFRQSKRDKNERDFIKLCLYEHVHYQHLKEEFEKLKAIMIKVVKKISAENRMNKFRMKPHMETIQQLEEEEKKS